MYSAPAVFCAPSVSVESTPYISTPEVFHYESYPWAVRTPEDSPVCWDVIPSGLPVNMLAQEGSCGASAHKELLRNMCEPFFQQMLTVMEQSLQTRVHPGSELAAIAEAMAYKTSSSFQPVFNSMSNQLEPILDEVSTEADETGAFGALFSGQGSEEESVDGAEPKFSETETLAPFTPTQDHDDDLEKSTMVCRHWKTKGWCKLDANCKFLHPEHKRGIAAPKAGARGSIAGGDMSGIANSISTVPGVPALSPDGELCLATRRRKRGGKNRSKQNKQMLPGNPEQDTVGLYPVYHAGNFQTLCAPCMTVV